MKRLLNLFGYYDVTIEEVPRGLRNLVHPQAFIDGNLALIGNTGVSKAPRLWGYKSEDNHATIDTSGYFDNASDRFKVGDLIDVVVVTNLDASDEAVATYGRHIVLTISAAGVVDTSDVTVGTMTDSD